MLKQDVYHLQGLWFNSQVVDVSLSKPRTAFEKPALCMAALLSFRVGEWETLRSCLYGFHVKSAIKVQSVNLAYFFNNERLEEVGRPFSINKMK